VYLRLDAIHRGNVGGRLRRLPNEALDQWRNDLLYSLLSGDTRGTYLFIVDSTCCSHHGCPENLTRTGRHGKMENHSLKDKRQKHKQRPVSGSHCFVMGLLLSPDGLRWPCCKSYHTKELMFRELKSVLGMADNKFNDFDCVEGWVGM
jgi:hypothetical protein